MFFWQENGDVIILGNKFYYFAPKIGVTIQIILKKLITRIIFKNVPLLDLHESGQRALRPDEEERAAECHQSRGSGRREVRV